MAVLLRARPSSEVGQACAREEATRMATRSRGFEVQPSGLLDLTNAGTASSRQISFSATISFSGTPPASDVVTAFRSIAWRASPRDGDRMRAEMRDAISDNEMSFDGRDEPRVGARTGEIREAARPAFTSKCHM